MVIDTKLSMFSKEDIAYMTQQLRARDRREKAALASPEAFLQGFLLGISGGIGIGAMFALAWLSA